MPRRPPNRSTFLHLTSKPSISKWILWKSAPRKSETGFHPAIEPLEPRHLLATWADLSIAPVAPTVPPHSPPATLESGNAQCEQDAATLRPAAPAATGASPLDVNLDGRFDSADVVAAYQASTTIVYESPSQESHASLYELLFESSDLIETLRVHAYEMPSQSADASCDQQNAHSQREYTYFDSETHEKNEVVTYEFIEENLHMRTVTQWDPFGNVHLVTIDTYAGELPSLAARTEQQYDARGRLAFQLDLFYDQPGFLRSSRTTTYDYYGGPIFQRTIDYHFDQEGRLTQRRTRQFDSNQILQVLDVTHYDVEASSEPTAGVPTAGTATDEFNSLPFHTDRIYLRQLRDAYLTTRLLLEPHEATILQMNELQGQQQLESLLSRADLSSGELDRFRHLNLYFRIVKDLVSLGQNDDAPDLTQRYAHVLDPTTGAWQPWFSTFAANENLTLPLPPLRVAFHLPDISPRQASEVAQTFRESVGPNAFQYFQNLRQNGADHIEAILESMRRVKTQIKLLELRTNGGNPAFGLIAARDKPDLRSIGLQPIRLLSAWYFFEKSPSGGYLRDFPSEDIIRQRVADELTDEETFYVLNLEGWPLTGEPLEIEANLQKLQRAADLIHESNPNLLIGYYRLLPRRDPKAAYAGDGSELYRAWQSHNDQVAAALNSSIDLFFPSLYVLHLGNETRTTAELWSTFASETIREATRIANGKPVVPFLSLYYHPNGSYEEGLYLPQNPKGWDWVEPELLLHQMLHLYQTADAFVLYNDLPTGWSDLVETQLVRSMEIVHSARQQRQIPELRVRYIQTMLQHRNQLLAREALERRIGETETTQTLTQQAIPRLKNVLSREIQNMQDELDEIVPFWDLLEAS